MKKIKEFIAIICFMFIILFLISFDKKSNKKFVQTKDSKITEKVYGNIPEKSYSTLEEKIYDIEFKRGEKSLFDQMGVAYNEPNGESNFDYTSLKEEITEEEKAKYEEIMNKAYVEGYHKASQSFYCPR